MRPFRDFFPRSPQPSQQGRTLPLTDAPLQAQLQALLNAAQASRPAVAEEDVKRVSSATSRSSSAAAAKAKSPEVRRIEAHLDADLALDADELQETPEEAEA